MYMNTSFDLKINFPSKSKWIYSYISQDKLHKLKTLNMQNLLWVFRRFYRQIFIGVGDLKIINRASLLGGN